MLEQIKLWSNPDSFLPTKLRNIIHELQDADAMFGGAGDILHAWHSLSVQTTNGQLIRGDLLMWCIADEHNTGINRVTALPGSRKASPYLFGLNSNVEEFPLELHPHFVTFVQWRTFCPQTTTTKSMTKVDAKRSIQLTIRGGQANDKNVYNARLHQGSDPYVEQRCRCS